MDPDGERSESPEPIGGEPVRSRSPSSLDRAKLTAQGSLRRMSTFMNEKSAAAASKVQEKAEEKQVGEKVARLTKPIEDGLKKVEVSANEKFKPIDEKHNVTNKMENIGYTVGKSVSRALGSIGNFLVPTGGRRTSISTDDGPIETVGTLFKHRELAHPFTLTGTDLEEVTEKTYRGKYLVMNIFPSVETDTCAKSVRVFNESATQVSNDVLVLCISADLPFTLKKFCGAEGLHNVIPLSCFRSTFSRDYRVQIATGSMRGLCSRSVYVLDPNLRVVYSKQIMTLGEEPDYDEVLSSLAAAQETAQARASQAADAAANSAHVPLQANETEGVSAPPGGAPQNPDETR